MQIENAPPAQHSLSGRLLYHYIQYERFHEDQYRNNTEDALKNAIIKLTATPTTNNSILRELLFINRLYQDEAIIKPLNAPLAILDQYLVERATTGIKDYTLMGWYAAAVISCYFAKRRIQTTVKAYLQKIISLWNKVESEVDSAFTRGITYQDNTPLGLEGVAGLLLMLIVIERSVTSVHLRRLIKEGVRYLLSFRRQVDFSQQDYNMFPSIINAQGKPVETPDYLGWGNGDLPQTLLFYRASDLFQNQELLQMSHLIGLNTLLRKEVKHTLAKGAELHSGSAGVAQMYRTLYQISGQQPYYQGYKLWLQHTLDLTKIQLQDNVYANQEYELMHGLVGIYLTLLTYEGKEKVDWREVLLL